MAMRHAILFCALPLAGCISFGGAVPASLLTLEPVTAVPIGTAQRATPAATVSILTLTTPASLGSARIPVQATPNTIAYVEDAQWTEPPARLFARLLGDTMTARTGRVVLPNQAVGDPGAQLGGELRRFGLDATTREGVVTFDAQLLRPDAATPEKRRFEARVPLTGEIGAAEAGRVLNEAANRVAAEVADWVGR